MTEISRKLLRNLKGLSISSSSLHIINILPFILSRSHPRSCRSLAWCSSGDSIMESSSRRTSGHIQLIDGTGNFDVAGMERFSSEIQFAQCGLKYGIVAIMGPQSSGKSTLLNHLYGTDFKEMDESEGRQQTTQGIWLGIGVGCEPLMVVLDLEGSDGSERGQDVNFEKQSALLALAVSDIVLINMFCYDIGREHGASRPLLKTLLQERMQMRHFRKITLMFVLRDKPQPREEQKEQKEQKAQKAQKAEERLKSQLLDDLEKIWNSVRKPEEYMQSSLSDLFRVDVEALSHYDHKREEFDGQFLYGFKNPSQIRGFIVSVRTISNITSSRYIPSGASS
ncbi:ROOT HAIR DEFECTIVE 3-like protein [Drosera capensis]